MVNNHPDNRWIIENDCLRDVIEGNSLKFLKGLIFLR